jgi:hypothetical protein
MVAFNFQSQFVNLIEAGKKISTIRQKKRCDVGDKMHLYTGQRTANCSLIKEVICSAVYPFHIDEYRRVSCKHPDAGYLYRQEGFNSPSDFIDFFNNQYGLPFSGYLHEWKEATQ